MADNQLHLDIITPERTVLSEDIESFEAPGVAGEFQVFANHTPFLSGLKIGHIAFTREGVRDLVAISGGFCEMRENRAVILAHTAEQKLEIDEARAEAAKKRAEQRLEDTANETTDFDRAQLALLRALNRLSAIGGD